VQRIACFVVLVLLACGGLARAEAPPQGPDALEWGQLAPLPDPIGFAGPFAGTTGDALIVAGGANFPDGRPWDGATKVWHDRIFVLTDPAGPWQTECGRLPRPLAYGASVSTDDGVLLLGGGDAERHYRETYLLRWDPGQKQVTTTELATLPEPCAFTCAARVGDTLYVAGGLRSPDAPTAMHNFWALDLARDEGAEPVVRKLQPWPGQPRMLAAAAVQSGSFFLVGGVALDPSLEGDNKRVSLTDCYRYDPDVGRWTRIADLPRPVIAAPSPAVPLGQSHFAVIGGDDGANADRIAELKDDHPGFPADVLCYHTVTDTWITVGEFPKDTAAGLWPPVTANTTWWRDRYVIPSGEARPGVRTPQVVWAQTTEITESFGLLDYGVLAVYLGALVAMGVYFSRREKTTGDFFLGGQRIPWWAAGMSIFGTQLSAITFMAIPAKSFNTDWIYLMANMMIVVMMPAVVFFYLPFYRRLNVTSAYEYLEKRFNKPTRLLGSASFVLFQLGRMGIVLFLPALALSTVTGIDIYACIVLMGVLATLYTVLGGIEAVIWTDVLQVVVLLGGAVLSLGIIVAHIDGGATAIYAMAADADKLRVANLDWDFTAAVLWVVVLGSGMQQLVSYTADQTVIQRYLTTRDEKAAARAIWTNAFLTIPATILFFGVGTALWAFYRSRPELLNPNGTSDYIFPWFIAQQLPAGVAGLVIAGLFAAAMSSLDSSMNSMATAITTDYYRWLRPNAPDHRCLKLARWLTVLLGLFGTASAAGMAYLQSESMWDQYIKVIGLFGGGLAGLFALGIFTRRTTGPGALVGFAASAGILYYVTTYTTAHGFLYVTVGIASCFLIGYVASLLLPSRKGDLDGLTIFTLRPRD